MRARVCTAHVSMAMLLTCMGCLNYRGPWEGELPILRHTAKSLHLQVVAFTMHSVHSSGVKVKLVCLLQCILRDINIGITAVKFVLNDHHAFDCHTLSSGHLSFFFFFLWN